MKLRGLASLVFVLGLGVLLLAAFEAVRFGDPPMRAGSAVLAQAGAETGAANRVTAVVLGYRALDTLGELTILFVAATAAGMVLSGTRASRPPSDTPAGDILRHAADLLFPFLLVLGIYIIVHGHLSPGGGFQGGAVLAAAFFIPLLARPGRNFNAGLVTLLEGGAGLVFVGIGLLALFDRGAFLAPLGGPGVSGALVSAGSLPLLYAAVGLKVGVELANLIARLASVSVAD